MNHLQSKDHIIWGSRGGDNDIVLGLVHTMPDKFENATLGAKKGTKVFRPHMKTDNMFCVHTTAFYRRRNCLISL